jgi:ABC-type molybdate transport system substrate-binding protein
MKLLVRAAVFASACALGLTAVPAPAPAADKVINAEVASSVRPPFEQFAKIYEQKHKGTTIAAKYLGGGVIQADVEADSPIDIVVVGKNQVDKLAARINTPVAVLTNREAIIVRRGETKVKTFKDLANPGVKVGMANGTGSAVGTLARTLLKNAAADYGADFPLKVRQNSPDYFTSLQSEDDVLKGLDAGQADVMIGFVSSVDPSKYTTIPIPDKFNIDSVYYIFIPKSAKNPKEAADMVTLMTNAQGKAILHSHRYLPAPKGAYVPPPKP